MKVKTNLKIVLKKIINPYLKRRFSYSKKVYERYIRDYTKKKDVKLFIIKVLLKTKIIHKTKNKGKDIQELLKKVYINIDKENQFVYSIDVYKTNYRNNEVLGNTTLNYEKVINTSFNDLKEELRLVKDQEYKSNQLEMINGIEIYSNRIIAKLRNEKQQINTIKCFENMKDKKAQSFKEALQRILFFHQILCQTGHMLNGLGRLDKILNDIYNINIKEKTLTKEMAKEEIRDFLKSLHKYYWFKSGELMGDTGQIIVLGGEEEDNTYFCNDLTYMFIEVLEELKLPDPKILLRVSNNIPRQLIESSIRCIQTGIGCPLFSNDDIIIPKLIEFGYKRDDAYNYITSACWEPLIVGRSLDPNNILSIVFLEPLERLLESENLNRINTEKELVERYKDYLHKYIFELLQIANKKNWEIDPIFSAFTESCNKRALDISQGGAEYNNFGFTSVSLSNTINSIRNITKLVYDTHKYTLEELNAMKQKGFDDNKLLKILKEDKVSYGKDNLEVINFTDEITQYVNNILKQYENRFGGKVKFGLSAPSYISKSKRFPASLDGRKSGEPFNVHISAPEGVAYTELVQFASKLDYSGHRFNGNVVDFVISPDFITNNFEKFTEFIILSIKLGFFQMQMNVVSSTTLIEAKEYPEKFPNLIVRVWGFSAYFNDLPEEYKKLLIERALQNEKTN